MTLSLDNNASKFQIRGFQPGAIQVNDEVFNRSLIISSNQLIIDWRPQDISELTNEDLYIIFEMEPAILLIGTGEKIHFPPVDIYGDLINKGIGVEIMDTRAACHTFNALTAEERNVVAALIIR